jgi:capsular exopolysaccharide synthesis family protein
MAVKKSVQQKGSNTSLFSIIAYKYLPYWPLFALLSIGLLSLAYLYTRYLTPVYKITATLVIDDEQKGVQESEAMRSLDVYATNTTVENEIQVLTSRTLMKDVVEKLHLYAPVFEKGRVKPAPAYLSSPIIVQVREPERLKAQEKIIFQYDDNAGTVAIEGRHHPLHQWIAFPYGVLRFVKNPNQKRFSVREMYFSLLDPKAVATAMSNNLEVGATSKLSSVVNIQYTDEIPERGEAVVNHLLEAYTRASVENNNRLAAGTLGFVNERIKDLERELDSIEQKIQQYRTTQGIVDLSQQGRLYLERVAESDRKAADINIQLDVLDQVEGYIRTGVNRTGIVPTTLGISDPVLADLLQRLNELELEYTNRRTRIGEENPMVKSVENEIKKIRPNILNIVQNQRRQLQSSLASYNRSSSQAGATLRSIPQKERQLLDISRQQATKNEVYAFLLQRREEAELSSASTIASSRIVDRAEAGITPVSSKKMIVLIGALIAAVALSVGYVFLREGLTGKVLFRSQITRSTAIPVIGEVVYRRHRKKSLSEMAVDPVLQVQFKQLQVAMDLFDETTPKQTILVTSGLADEGKTFISNGLAISLAAAGKKVLLLDLNFYASETTALHQLKEAKGISDHIQGHAALNDIVYKLDFANLYVMPAGTYGTNATALLLNKGIDELITTVQSRYDFIIMDTPPVEMTTDAYLLGRHCQAALYVIRQGKTPNTLLQKLNANQKLQAMPELAVVFNGIRPRGFLRKYYGYGYGYGYENVFVKKAYGRAE